MKRLSELVNLIPQTPESRLLPENPANGDIPCFDATATVGGGIDNDTHLMLHFDEESGIPADSSQDEILVTANDTAADAATAKFGKARNLNNSYLSLTCPAMSTGTGDFTYEGWFYFNELNKRRGLFGVDMGLYVALWGDNTFGVAISTSGSSWNYNHMDSSRSEATATQGVWQHIALVRNKGNVTLYLNGNSILSFDIGADTVITGNMGNNPFRIGYPLGGMSSVADFCDEFRFSTVARWTGNFTPPDAPYSKQVIEGEWGTINKSELAMKSELTAALTGKANQSELAAYQKKSEAFSGQYSDLAGKPSTFPPAAHSHTIANVTDLQATVDKAHEHANKAALDKISEAGGKLAYGGTAVGGASGWTELADKPSTFPPAAHSHTIANVTDLQTMLNSKAASAHGHAVADVTGLQSLLDGKAAVGHTHAAADVTGLATALAGKVSSVNGLTPDDSGALVLPQATSGAAGLMAAADKLKLDTFTNYTEKSGTEKSGYIRFPGGLIMQFGSKEILTPEAFVSGSIVFPRSFVDKPLSVTASVQIDNLVNAPFALSLYAPNTISVVFSGPHDGPPALEKIVLHWMAIGIEYKPPTNPSPGV